MPTPPRLTDGYIANFATLRRAAADGALALVSAIRKADGQPVALVCAMQRTGDSIMPLAVLCEGNPFDDFYDPTEN